jgi:hypothetical protein
VMINKMLVDLLIITVKMWLLASLMLVDLLIITA